MAFPLPVWLAVQEELLGYGGEEDAARSCFDDFDEEALFQMFHLTRPCLSFIADYVRVRMSTKITPTKPALSGDVMIMVALNYYAHGISSVAILRKAGLSMSDCTAVICSVSGVIAEMCEQFVSFPRSREARAAVASKAETLCGIPNVLGVLHAAHFKIRASPYEKSRFRTFVNSLGFTSALSQIICDSDGNILSVEKCCAGSTFEQEVWESSLIGKEVEQEAHGPHWVVGGSGYNLSKHLLTPVSGPANEKESRFNQAHAKIHNVMRTTLGSMKRRFRCLMQLGFAQEGLLDRQYNIIKTCCVLHNVAKKFSVPSPSVDFKIEHLDPGKQRSAPVATDPEALKARQELIDGKSSLGSSVRETD
ncbi:putative nuclease HARBI1 [Brachionichthys hirsutus]|uniref:putative nuclease HARBI1 n=1 Tax=Brachionichthys hirsutus TaxID=412623 RepID=UPI003604624B